MYEACLSKLLLSCGLATEHFVSENGYFYELIAPFHVHIGYSFHTNEDLPLLWWVCSMHLLRACSHKLATSSMCTGNLGSLKYNYLPVTEPDLTVCPVALVLLVLVWAYGSDTECWCYHFLIFYLLVVLRMILWYQVLFHVYNDLYQFSVLYPSLLILLHHSNRPMKVLC